MKHISQVLTFAAVLAASLPAQQPTPEQQFAAALAAETQERDFAKAERLYREALAGTALSAEARLTAQFRLGRLLRTLGRQAEGDAVIATAMQAGGKGAVATLDDVTAQDAEREATLRAQAAELVQKLSADPGNGHLIPQLAWYGEAAVPEVIAGLERLAVRLGEPPSGTNAQVPQAVTLLAGVLWQRGGTKGAAFLAGAAKHPNVVFRSSLAAAAYRATDPALVEVAARYLDDPDRQVVAALFRQPADGTQPVVWRLPATRLLVAAQNGSNALRHWVLHMATQPAFDGAGDVGPALVALIRTCITTADAELGLAAVRALGCEAGQATVDGLILLTQQIAGTSLPLEPWAPPVHPGRFPKLALADAERLEPALLAGAAILQGSERCRGWLSFRMRQVVESRGAAAVPSAMQWLDLGYDWVAASLPGRLQAEHVPAVLARLSKAGNDERVQLLQALAGLDLSPAAFGSLRALADGRALDLKSLHDISLLLAVGRTASPDAATWLAAQAPGHGKSIAALLAIAARCREEPVLAALRAQLAAVAAKDEPKPEARDLRARLLLALLALGDRAALAQVGPNEEAVVHPFGAAEEVITPLRYVLEQGAAPALTFAEQDQVEVIRRIGADPRVREFEFKRWRLDRLSDAVVMAMVELPDQSENNRLDWTRRGLVQRLLDESLPQARRLALQAFAERMLTGDSERQADAMFRAVGDLEAASPFRTVLTALLVDPREGRATAAAHSLLRHGWLGGLADLPRLATSAHAGVREYAVSLAGQLGAEAEGAILPLLGDPADGVRFAAANFLGAMLSKAAVPGLLAMLRDPGESNRTAAADALQRIRFYHEQQAHWDRVLRGLDSSPGSAMEKLLLQAKADAPREQRLLAIRSLGVLGVPEALPFLIEWCNESDAELAAAAKAAVQQIHAQPRR